MITIRHSAVTRVPVEVAFEYLADYRTVPGWLFGISTFEPNGGPDYGLGATYDAAMKIGPKTLRSVVKITEWERNRLITLDSTSGFRNKSSWRFEADGDETRLSVDFGYELPGGLAGKTLGRLIEPFAGQAVRHTDATLRVNLEGQEPA
ncbi:MAG: SRPBCC family protein [Tomitella sp.]|nr:SRPBCC family protein [Tomitella sp.]